MATSTSVPSGLPGQIGMDTEGNPVFANLPDPIDWAKAIDRPKGEWATHFAQGGALAQARADQALLRRQALQRQQLLKQVAEANARATQAAEARQKATEQRQRLIQERQIKQQARKTGQTVSQFKSQQLVQQQKQLGAITTAESLRGGELTRLQFQRAMGGAGQISLLRKGTRAEQRYFKRTGFSLSKARKERPLVTLSEGVYQDLQSRASGGDKIAQQQLYRVGQIATFPQQPISGDLNQVLFDINKPQNYVEAKLSQGTLFVSKQIERVTPQKIKDYPLTGKITEFKLSAIETIGKPFLRGEKLEQFETGIESQREALKFSLKGSPTFGDFMFKTKIPFRHTDVAKFVFFSPAMLTTPQTVEQAISTGAIKPISQTRVKALVLPKEDFSEIKVITSTRIAGQKVLGISKQIVRQQGKDLSIDISKGVSIVGKGGGSRQITTFEAIGVSKQLGQARGVTDFVDDFSRLYLKKDIGTGFYSRTLTQNTQKTLFRTGIGIFKRTSTKSLPGFTSAKFSPTGKIKFDTTIKFSDDITGVISPTADFSLSKLIAKTGKPITRVSKEGDISKILYDINVAGFIKKGGTTQDSGSSILFAKGGVPKPLTQTQQLTTQQLTTPLTIKEAKSVFQQTGGLVSRAEQSVIKEITKPTLSKVLSKPSQSISVISELKTKQADIIPSGMFREININRFDSLDNLGKVQGLGILGKSKTKQISLSKTKQILKQLPKEKQLSSVIQKSALKTNQLQKQSLRLDTKLKSKQLQQSRGAFPSMRVKIPKTIIPFIPFYKKKKRKLREPKLKKFNIYGRRFGKWKRISSAKSEKKAFAFGKDWARKTLGVSFKIKGAKPRKLKGFKTKFEKGSAIYIEPRRKRLKRGGSEVREIQFFKGLKSPFRQSKKKKKKKGRYDLW